MAKQPPQFGPLIRKKRKQLGLTLQALCKDADLSPGYLSQVERGNATPSLGTLSKVANALGVGIEFFVATPKTQDALTRAGFRSQFALDDDSLVYEAVSRHIPGGDLSSYIINIPPGFISETINHEGEEIVFVLEGQVLHKIDDESFMLNVGDSLHYQSEHFHSFANPGKTVARILCTCTPPLFDRKKHAGRRG